MQTTGMSIKKKMKPNKKAAEPAEAEPAVKKQKTKLTFDEVFYSHLPDLTAFNLDLGLPSNKNNRTTPNFNLVEDLLKQVLQEEDETRTPSTQNKIGICLLLILFSD